MSPNLPKIGSSQLVRQHLSFAIHRFIATKGLLNYQKKGNAIIYDLWCHSLIAFWRQALKHKYPCFYLGHRFYD